MVLFELSVQCNFECIKLLYVDINEYEWCIKVKCTGCGEESQNWHTFNAQESNPLKGGRGSANFLYKCKLCSRENSIDVVKDSLRKVSPPVKSDKYVSLVRFDCRGLEPIGFQPKSQWTAEAENSNTTFSDIDLSENDWADYDTNANETVGIYDFTSKFDRVK